MSDNDRHTLGSLHSGEEPPAPELPIVLGFGRAGLRITARLAKIVGHGVRVAAVFPESAPSGPSPVPTISWPSDRDGRLHAASDLARRVGNTRAAILAVGLGASAPAAIAPEVARAVRSQVTNLAAVGVAPFSFEGPTKLELADEVMRDIGGIVDLLAIASRDDVRAVAPPDIPLERACELVDEIAASASEALLRSLARRREPLRLSGKGWYSVGAAQAYGAGATVQAVRTSVIGSLLRRERLSTSTEALLVLVLGRTPTLGEVCAAEDLLRDAMAPNAEITFEIVTEQELGERAIAAVCVSLKGERTEDGLFPSEDPQVLEVPAFLRRRSAGGSPHRAGRGRWPRSA